MGTRAERGALCLLRTALHCQESRFKKKKKKELGGGDRLVLYPQELREHQRQITTLSMETQLFNSLLRSKSGGDIFV